MGLSSKLWVVFIAALPVSELRGAVPYGISTGLPWLEVFMLAVIGNLLPVIPIFLFLKFFLLKARKVKIIDNFFFWWFNKVDNKSALIKKYGFWGLVLFVAVPLPVTGAWTGITAAFLLKFKLKRAFTAILLGVIIAGIVVTGFSLGVFRTIYFIN